MEQQEPRTEETLEWRVWPAADKPALSVVVAIAALAFCVLATWSFSDMSFGVVGLVVLLLVLSSHYLPSYYRLDETGVTVRGWGACGAKKWTDLPYAWDCGVAILLTATPGSARRSAGRGSVLLRLNDNHDQVIAFLSKRIQIIDKSGERRRHRWPR